MKRFWIPQILISAMLLWALRRNPSTYYIALRWTCCVVFIWFAINAFLKKHYIIPWMFVLMAWLYNPLYPVYLRRSTWSPINIGTVLIVGLLTSIIYERTEEKGYKADVREQTAQCPENNRKADVDGKYAERSEKRRNDNSKNGRTESDIEYKPSYVANKGYPDDWDTIRRKIYTRDNRKCKICGATNRILHAHHIIPKSNGGEDTERNLITLCDECHKSIHPFMKEKDLPQDFEIRRCAVLARDGNKCRTCSSDNESQLSVVPMIPIAYGGDFRINNLITLCCKCRLKTKT